MKKLNAGILLFCVCGFAMAASKESKNLVIRKPSSEPSTKIHLIDWKESTLVSQDYTFPKTKCKAIIYQTAGNTVMVDVGDSTNCSKVTVFDPVLNSVFQKKSFIFLFDKVNMPFQFTLDSESDSLASDWIEISK